MKGVQYCVKYKTRQKQTVRFDVRIVVPCRLGWDVTRWGRSANNALSLSWELDTKLVKVIHLLTSDGHSFLCISHTRKFASDKSNTSLLGITIILL